MRRRDATFRVCGIARRHLHALAGRRTAVRRRAVIPESLAACPVPPVVPRPPNCLCGHWTSGPVLPPVSASPVSPRLFPFCFAGLVFAIHAQEGPRRPCPPRPDRLRSAECPAGSSHRHRRWDPALRRASRPAPCTCEPRGRPVVSVSPRQCFRFLRVNAHGRS